ncbi:DnaJ domain-containing protein, partial [Podospora aff. communis PSN243]
MASSNVPDVGDYYNTLGVSSSATPDEIRRAYLKLIRKMHPDKSGNTPEATAATQRLTEAFQVLKDPAKRSAYD